MDLIGVDYKSEDYVESKVFYGFLVSFKCLIYCFLYGVLFFFLIYIVIMVVGGMVELIFSIVWGYEINEGFLVIGMLLLLMLLFNMFLW